jgi:transposase
MKLGKYFKNIGVGKTKTLQTKIYGVLIKITCLGLEKEYLFIASNSVIGKNALLKYKQRWSIERTFKAMKTSGFNMEDTHMTDLNKLKKLFAVLSVALVICVVAGEIKNRVLPIKIKNYQRKLYSLFTYGLDWLRHYFFGDHHDEISGFFKKLMYKIKMAI